MKKLFWVAAAVILAVIIWNAPSLEERAARARGSQMASEVPPLRDQYAGLFPIGNVISPRDLGTIRFEALQRHFDILTAENHMKPDHLQRVQGVWTFGPADSIVNAAREAGMQFHGHTLMWHQQSPSWMNYPGISRDRAIENLQTHIRTVMAHFRGRVVSWDVLNEAIDSNPSDPYDWVASLRDTPWLRAIGPDYVEIAFRTAREADPGAILYYNDYNMDNQRKAIAVYNMVRDINARNPDVLGRPLIDAVGMQGHYRLGTNVENVRASMLRFASLGVQVSITELDVLAGDHSFLTDAQALQQGILYARLFSLFREHADILGRVTIWGLDDGTSWRSRQSPVLFDRSLRAKPAFFAALNPEGFLVEHGVIPAGETKHLWEDALFGTQAIPGKIPLVTESLDW
ncbi:MAG: endo-1,4-beta-xylanase [Treponema sp.]|nr:endo-1,4-beta-xylanase [Treponema sp.]